MRIIKERNAVVLTLFFLNFGQQWTSIDAGKVKINCPEFCECDIYENLKRAVCQDKRLVSMELNIPPHAEILDLSDNQISELGDKIFLEIGLTHLKLLNLSHNKIRQIHFNAFVGLENVKTLDLSFNAVEYFTDSWFDSLTSLEELYLRGNKLRKINEEATIDLKTLRVLDISKCGITRLTSNTLKLVPNLEILDISENFIQVIHVDILKTLPKLITLKAHENNFNCKDENFVEVRTYIKSKRINYTDSCAVDFPTSFTVNNKVHKFEKMQMAEDIEVMTEPTNSSKNLWIFDEEEEGDGAKIVEVCSNGTMNDDDSLLMEIIQLSPWMTLSITFVYGVLCGMVLTCAINLCASKKEPRIRSDTEVPDGSVHCNIRSTQSVPNTIARKDRKNLHRSNSVLYKSLQKARRQVSGESHTDDDEDDETLVMHEFDLANSTPVAPRRVFT